jgi:hypothetical protein
MKPGFVFQECKSLGTPFSTVDFFRKSMLEASCFSMAFRKNAQRIGRRFRSQAAHSQF